MKKRYLALVLLVWAPLAFAVTPYIAADKVAPGDVKAVMGAVEAPGLIQETMTHLAGGNYKK